MINTVSEKNYQPLILTKRTLIPSGQSLFKAGKYVVGIGKYNTLLLPCGRSRLLQRRGRVFAFRSCGPGSIPTLGVWDSSAPCDTGTKL